MGLALIVAVLERGRGSETGENGQNEIAELRVGWDERDGRLLVQALKQLQGARVDSSRLNGRSSVAAAAGAGAASRRLRSAAKCRLSTTKRMMILCAI